MFFDTERIITEYIFWLCGVMSALSSLFM